MADPTGMPLPDGHTLIFATVGDPIVQAKAPAMMSAALAARGVNGVWLPIAADSAHLPSVFAAVRGWRNFAGLSVTVPHKAAALGLVDRVSARGIASGAINVVRREADGSLSGDMVDGAGFVAGLAARGVVVCGLSAWVVGAGGAGSAIAAALCEAGVAAIAVVDCDPARVAALGARLAEHYPAVRFVTDGSLAGAADLAINATPMGLRATDPMPFDPARLRAGTLVCDVVMEPAETPLLARAAAMGYPTQPGLPMLVHQADLYLDYFRVPAA